MRTPIQLFTEFVEAAEAGRWADASVAQSLLLKAGYIVAFKPRRVSAARGIIEPKAKARFKLETDR